MLDNREARRMMQRMGMEVKEVPDVTEVIIRSAGKEITLRDPTVSEITTKGLKVFQVTAEEIEEREIKGYKEEDVLLVMSQAGVDREKAEASLASTNGDIAAAIVSLQVDKR
jgi:nascent polypeptide-associated complex subunit alpha